MAVGRLPVARRPRLDQRDLRRTLPVLYALEAAAFVALALLAGNFWLPAVLALGVVDGTIALTGRALSRGTVATFSATVM